MGVDPPLLLGDSRNDDGPASPSSASDERERDRAAAVPPAHLATAAAATSEAKKDGGDPATTASSSSSGDGGIRGSPDDDDDCTTATTTAEGIAPAEDDLRPERPVAAAANDDGRVERAPRSMDAGAVCPPVEAPTGPDTDVRAGGGRVDAAPAETAEVDRTNIERARNRADNHGDPSSHSKAADPRGTDAREAQATEKLEKILSVWPSTRGRAKEFICTVSVRRTGREDISILHVPTGRKCLSYKNAAELLRTEARQGKASARAHLKARRDGAPSSQSESHGSVRRPLLHQNGGMGNACKNNTISGKRRAESTTPCKRRNTRAPQSSAHRAKKQRQKISLSFSREPSTSHLPVFGNMQFYANTFGGKLIQTVSLKDTHDDDCFLTKFFLGGTFSVEKKLLKKPFNTSGMEVVHEEDGIKQELIGMKIERRKGGLSLNMNSYFIRWTYVKTKALGKKKLNIQQILNDFAGFEDLPTHKAVARLELLMTKGLFYESKASDFEEIDESGDFDTCGCGYIPVEKLRDICPGKRKIWSIQVRILIPSLGLFKGMLEPKLGISKIQLPKSMKKVGPSKNGKADWGVVLVCACFPSERNRHLNSYYDKRERDPPKSFESNLKRYKLSKMYQFALEGLGVPKRIVTKYVNDATKKEKLKHGSFVGIADPTGWIPHGHVFISGPIRNFAGRKKKVLVSRSPCMEPSDFKLLPVCEDKPPRMPNEAWDLICSNPIGKLIFPTKRKKGFRPLSECVGEGDCDGDPYLVIWSNEIISEITNKDIPPDLLYEKTSRIKEARTYPIGGNNWLSKAQTMMLEYERVRCSQNLIGTLYSLCQKKAEKSNEHIFDKDARCFARAYKDALKVAKHGQRVCLPERLHSDLPPDLQPLVYDDKSSSIVIPPSACIQLVATSHVSKRPCLGRRERLNLNYSKQCIECLKKNKIENEAKDANDRLNCRDLRNKCKNSVSGCKSCQVVVCEECWYANMHACNGDTLQEATHKTSTVTKQSSVKQRKACKKQTKGKTRATTLHGIKKPCSRRRENLNLPGNEACVECMKGLKAKNNTKDASQKLSVKDLRKQCTRSRLGCNSCLTITGREGVAVCQVCWDTFKHKCK